VKFLPRINFDGRQIFLYNASFDLKKNYISDIFLKGSYAMEFSGQFLILKIVFECLN